MSSSLGVSFDFIQGVRMVEKNTGAETVGNASIQGLGSQRSSNEKH